MQDLPPLLSQERNLFLFKKVSGRYDFSSDLILFEGMSNISSGILNRTGNIVKLYCIHGVKKKPTSNLKNTMHSADTEGLQRVGHVTCTTARGQTGFFCLTDRDGVQQDMFRILKYLNVKCM